MAGHQVTESDVQSDAAILRQSDVATLNRVRARLAGTWSFRIAGSGLEPVLHNGDTVYAERGWLSALTNGTLVVVTFATRVTWIGRIWADVQNPCAFQLSQYRMPGWPVSFKPADVAELFIVTYVGFGNPRPLAEVEAEALQRDEREAAAQPAPVALTTDQKPSARRRRNKHPLTRTGR